MRFDRRKRSLDPYRKVESIVLVGSIGQFLNCLALCISLTGLLSLTKDWVPQLLVQLVVTCR
jgi:hypothetical protein